MLTADLVRTRQQKGELRPAFVDPADEKVRTRADDLVALFSEGIGRRRGELLDEVEALIGDATDHQLARGLVKVMLDRAEFAVSAPIAPAELRARVFRTAAKLGPFAVVRIEGGRPTIEDVYAEVAAEIGVDPAVLPGVLHGDHDERQVLATLDVPSGEWLLHRYNVALVQALLLRCDALTVRLVAPEPARARQLFRAVKFHQLIHAVRPTADGYELVLDGPSSLFSQTTRYGVALAKFFPALLLQPGAWTATAQVAWTRGKRAMSISSADGLRSHYRDVGGWETREARWFAERFEALESGWKLVRDAAPITQGGEGVIVPDFSFKKGKKVAHLEILGFWRKGTVAKRLQLLKRHGPKNLVLAVSKRLAGEAGELPDAVVPFAEVIPAKEVLRRVEEIACS